MCGIAGIITQRNSAQDVEGFLAKAVQCLKHRGPDDSGTWHKGEAGLGLAHTRLSIQDLSHNGQQPMTGKSGRHTIVFNGEVYNFKELRSELQGQYSFTTGTDTEVLLAAIEAWGLDRTLERIDGMYAFALFDAGSNTLTLVRDRMGEKPLYLGWVGDDFLFASELSVYRNHCRFANAISHHGLALYLRYGYIPSPYTIHAGIYKLPPASKLSFDIADPLSFRPPGASAEDNTATPANITKYWDLSATRDKGDAISDPEEAAHSIEQGLFRSIRNRMVSDAPIGAFLSGGIDSSLVCAIMQQISPTPIKTFTIGFTHAEFNEADHARRIAAHLGTDHTETILSDEDLLGTAPQIAALYDEPFANPSNIPTYLIAREAGKKVKVCLAGDGGDELFYGYNRYMMTDATWRLLRHIPHALRGRNSVIRALQAVIGRLPLSVMTRKKADKIAGLLSARNEREMYDRLMAYCRPAELSPLLATPQLYNREEAPDHRSFVEYAASLDQEIYLTEDCLTKVDRASMNVGLECRLPLLATEVIATANRIPETVHIDHNKGKILLREILSKYIPAALFERPKQGFSVPVGNWLSGPLREWGSDLIEDACNNDHFDSTAIRNLWENRAHNPQDSQCLWAVLVYQSWLQGGTEQ